MKRTLLFFVLSAALLVVLASCASRPTEWQEDQRIAFVETLDNYRGMVYINDLNDSEFIIFTGDLVEGIEGQFPVYTEFIAMPAVADTVDMWVVTTIVSDLDEDANNMRHIYPYRTLRKSGVLPSGLDHNALKAFYTCFAQKVNNHFDGVEQFFYAVLSNNIDPNIISKMQGECANDLFNWVITEEEVTVVE